MKAILKSQSLGLHEDVQCLCAEWGLDVVWNEKQLATVVSGSSEEIEGLLENEIRHDPYFGKFEISVKR